MKNVIYFLAFLTLLSCGTERQDNRLDSIDKFMVGQAEYFKFNGNVLVAEKGKVIYQKSFGVRDFFTNEPLNDSSVFELASVSKQFTAMGILLLEKQGKLSLSDSLRQYFPELPYKNISLHHMLTHTSGLPDYKQAMISKWDRKKIAFNSDMISFLAREKISVNFEPGDLLKWDRGLVDKTLIGEATLTKMIFPHALSDSTANVHYGYGVFIGKNELGSFITHSGGWPGYVTYLARYTDDDRTIIILSNNQSSSDAIQATISNILFGQPIVLPYSHKPISLDSSSLEMFTGSFSIKGRKFDIIREGDTLVQVFRGRKYNFVPESSTKVFSSDGLDVQFEILKNGDNELKHYKVLYGVKEQMLKLQK